MREAASSLGVRRFRSSGAFRRSRTGNNLGMTLLVIVVVLLIVGAIAATLGTFDRPRRRVVRQVEVAPTRTVVEERTIVTDSTINP